MSFSSLKAPSRLINRLLRRQGTTKARDNEKTERTENEGEQPLLTKQDEEELINLLKENISMDFILEMKEAFQLFDKNGDGFISAKELGVLMRTLGRNPTEDEIMQIMNEIDVDHNGKLDFSEFTVMMRDKLSNDDIELEIKQAFRVFDRNGDGYISKAEFKHCMMHFGEQFTDEEVEEMIAEADSNKDGRIDYEEFSQMILREIELESREEQEERHKAAEKATMKMLCNLTEDLPQSTNVTFRQTDV